MFDPVKLAVRRFGQELQSQVLREIEAQSGVARDITVAVGMNSNDVRALSVAEATRVKITDEELRHNTLAVAAVMPAVDACEFYTVSRALSDATPQADLYVDRYQAAQAKHLQRMASREDGAPIADVLHEQQDAALFGAYRRQIGNIVNPNESPAAFRLFSPVYDDDERARSGDLRAMIVGESGDAVYTFDSRSGYEAAHTAWPKMQQMASADLSGAVIADIQSARLALTGRQLDYPAFADLMGFPADSPHLRTVFDTLRGDAPHVAESEELLYWAAAVAPLMRMAYMGEEGRLFDNDPQKALFMDAQFALADHNELHRTARQLVLQARQVIDQLSY